MQLPLKFTYRMTRMSGFLSVKTRLDMLHTGQLGFILHPGLVWVLLARASGDNWCPQRHCSVQASSNSEVTVTTLAVLRQPTDSRLALFVVKRANRQSPKNTAWLGEEQALGEQKKPHSTHWCAC